MVNSLRSQAILNIECQGKHRHIQGTFNVLPGLFISELQLYIKSEDEQIIVLRWVFTSLYNT